MGDKNKKIYDALVDGASDGLSDDALFRFVKEKHPKTSSKKIVRASLLALSDPKLRDRNILNTIYALAIKHRLDDGKATDLDEDMPATDLRELPPAPAAESPKPKACAKRVTAKADVHTA